eukprot:15359597-Ditylum_brightwellii.AAC.1
MQQKAEVFFYHSVKSTDAKEKNDGVDDCFNECVASHVDCCVGKEDGVGDSADGGDNHLAHLTQVVDWCQNSRKEQNTCNSNAMKSRSVLYHSMKLTYAKEEEDGVDECVDGCFSRCVDIHVDCCIGKEDGVGDSADD